MYIKHVKEIRFKSDFVLNNLIDRLYNETFIIQFIHIL